MQDFALNKGAKMPQIENENIASETALRISEILGSGVDHEIIELAHSRSWNDSSFLVIISIYEDLIDRELLKVSS